MNDLDELEIRMQIEKMPGAAIVVNDQQSYADAGAILRDIATVKKNIKAKFDEPKRKAAEAHKAICNMEKEFLALATAREDEIRQKMTAYWQAEQARIRAEEERKRREAEEAAKKAAEAEATGNVEAAAAAIAEAAVAENNVSIAPKADGISMRETWTAKVIDVDKVPREYMVVNLQALNAFAKATKGSVKIPGVEFVKEIVSSVRSK